MSQVKIAAVWRFNEEETEYKFGATAGGIVCVISECGKYWFGSVNTDTIVGSVGKIFDSSSLCSIGERLENAWEKIRLAILSDTIGPPTEGKSPYNKKHEEKCILCFRMKDIGCPCWWCGNK